ncbi:MAG: ribosome biogenesis GTPase Der [Bacilli bacterium]
MKLPVVALVGRPNVGKSTIFNKLIGKKVAIIEDTPGITRDRIYGTSVYKNYKFHVIDTGGVDITNAPFNDKIKVQVELAVDEADVIIFVVDGKEGLNENDYIVRDMLKKSGKNVVVVVNKIDTKKAEENKYDFYELGFDSYIFISGEHNIGINDMLDKIVSYFKKVLNDNYSDDVVKFCLIGRPNVGKSSLANSLLNEERVIVSEVAGTTRDAIDSPFVYEGINCVVIDTAGIRRKGKVYETTEKYSVLRAVKAIDRSDVAVVVIDAEEGIINQDMHIAGYAKEAGVGVIIVVNKWDLVKKDDKAMKKFTDEIRESFKFLSFAPIVFLSAYTKKRIHTLMPEIIKVNNNCKTEVKTSMLNNVIMDAVGLNPPPSYKGRRLKIYFSHQSGIKPPKFTIQVNDKGLIHFSYERYIENKLRENFNLEGTPIMLQFKNKGEQ